ncbi:YcxB family protein [Variovorax gossypii]|uniref:YcxB family protein n=1 Tax=Variovorax gossypii TaxID=1679495 RepID=A0A3S0QCN8_9BURK|nr:YcxB family protein [Variovorax gossypii]RTQ36928.1 YcxB family protein [Variovorax gossypii]
MIATFRISEDDYADAMRLFARPTPLRWALLAAIGLLLLLGALIGGPGLWPAAVGGMVGMAIVLLATRLLTPAMARRHYRKYKAMQAEFQAELLETGLRLASPHGDGTVVWENVLKWRQNDRFVLIYPMPRLYHIVPKSIASQGFDLQGLTQRLERYVGPPF